jgi:WD40 repeat protein
MIRSRAVSTVFFLTLLSARAHAGEENVLFEVYGTPSQLASSPDGTVLAATDSRRNIVLWSVPERRRPREIDQAGGDGNALAFSPNGTMLAASAFRSIRIWDVAGKREPASLNGHQKQVVSLDFSNDGTRLASLGSDGTLIVWNIDSNDEVFRKVLAVRSHGQAGFRADGALLVAGTKDRLIQVWEVRSEDANLVAQWDHREWNIWQLSFSPERKRLALAIERESGDINDRCQIHIWDLTRAQVAASLKQGKFLVFDVESAAPNLVPAWGQALQGHKGPVCAMAFTPDGSKLVSGSGDRFAFDFGFGGKPGTRAKTLGVRERAVKVWDLATMQEIVSLNGHTSPVRSLAISPDSTTIFSGSRDSTVRFWSVPDAAVPNSPD